MERWKNVPGYEGSFQVSDQGRIFSLPRRNSRGALRRARMLRQDLIAGYPSVTMQAHGKAWRIKVHRLVLLVFAGPCPQGMMARHKDGTRTNSRLSNLHWGTPAENMEDQRAHGVLRIGSRHGMAKLTEKKVRRIRTLHAKGRSLRALAKQFGVSDSMIGFIVQRKNWKHVK